MSKAVIVVYSILVHYMLIVGHTFPTHTNLVGQSKNKVSQAKLILVL